MAELVVLHTESSKGWGGQEHRTFKEARGMARHGVRVLFACQPGSRLAERAEAEGFAVTRVRMRSSVDFGAVNALVKLIQRERVDVVNTHSGRDSLLAGLAGRLAWRQPLVVRTRHLALPITSRFTYSVLPHHVVAVSEYVRQYLISEGVAAERVSTIYTGIEPDALALDGPSSLRGELGLGPEVPLVGTVAILRQKKGHHLIVDAVPQILQALPDAHFVFAGDGPQTDNLKAQIAALGLSGRVHLLGLRRDVANVLAGLDLFVLPTREEALGTAYIEAMAMGLPIVGTQVGGVPEVVGDGDNGLLVPVDDSPALAAAIIRLLSDPATRAAMAARSRDRVVSHFLTDTMCEHMVLLYRRLLAGRSR